jgi:hypothetical protein
LAVSWPNKRPGATLQTIPKSSTTKPFFRFDEIRLKLRAAHNCGWSDNGVEMLDIIISLFYRQSCKASLSAIRLQKHLWA